MVNDLWLEKERILNEVMDHLERKYVKGLYDFLHTHDRALYDRIDEIENVINGNFAEGGSVEEFKATLRGYWDAHMEGIRKFKTSGQTSFDFTEARQARIQEREALAY